MGRPGRFYRVINSQLGEDDTLHASDAPRNQVSSHKREQKQRFYDKSPRPANTKNGGTPDNAQRNPPSPATPSPEANINQSKFKRGRIFNGRRDKVNKRYWRNLTRGSHEDPSQSSDSEDEPIHSHTSPTNSRSKGDRGDREDSGKSPNDERLSPRKSGEAADNSTDSSVKSSSISPTSGKSSSITDWEDQFVVHMPTAKEPNPPTMTTQQISEYQQSIENVHRNGEAMIDPESLPSPRTTTPENESDRQPHERPNNPRRKSVRRGRLNETNKGHSSTSHGQYYSPEEIGKPKGDATYDESSPKPPQHAQEVNLDGSFLGCREINTPGDKNLDEVLLFSPIDENAEPTEMPPPTQTREEKTAPSNPLPSGPEEKTTVSEKCDATSRNSSPAPCSKPSSLTIRYRMKSPRPSTPKTSSPTSGKENSQPTCSPWTNLKKEENSPKDDDVFIITPTITRTMVTIKGKDGTTRKQHGIQRHQRLTPGHVIPETNKRPLNYMPSKLRPGIQNSQERSTAPCMTSSETDPIRSIPVTRTDAKPERADIGEPHNTRGFIPMPGMVKSSTENLVGSMQNDPQYSAAPMCSREKVIGPGRSFSELARIAKSLRCPDISPLSSTSSSPGQSVYGSLRAAKCIEVAELDGYQVDNKPEDLHPKITDVTDEFPDEDVQPDDKAPISTLTFALIFNIFIISAAQVERLCNQCAMNRYIKVALMSVPMVIEHCFHVLRSIIIAVSNYKKTGSLPWPKDKDLNQILAEVGKAIASMVALTFFVMVVGRVAWYVVLIGTWIVWFAKPFGLIATLIGRIVLN
ncbi:NTP binding protein [Aspergillus sclerotialis]|uniref:NTP binding protein n=1 Tax=Aspergillus sclerotialis TaxID=2070753 RepID=A0A3A3A0B7_9EURO|nr:NTP binding protein [Aspergillus sclerotialis]